MSRRRKKLHEYQHLGRVAATIAGRCRKAVG